MASYVTSLRNQRLIEITLAQDAGAGAGTLRFYDGTVPANAGSALSGNTLLSQHNLSDPSAPNASGGVLTYNAIADDTSADASGTPTFCRTLDSDANVVAQFLCPSEVSIGAITATNPVEVTSLTITEGNA